MGAASPPGADAEQRRMMNVYFTIDTEASMAGAWADADRRPIKADRHIFCRIDGRDHGIGLIADALSEYGFRATFFVETLMTLVNGDDDVRSVFDFLLARDQDVQLHLHPTYRFYAEARRAMAIDQPYQPPPTNDLLSSFDEPRQMELIDEAVSLFTRFAGTPPVAFRAGCFAANRITLRCLQRAGLVVDTSFNPCYPAWSFARESLQPNQVRTIEGVSEIPVTVARTPIPEGYGGLKHADPSALSFEELRAMLEHGVENGQRHFVIVFHSFAAVKTADIAYSRLKRDWLTIGRLQRLLAYLNEHQDRYRVSTFGALAHEEPGADSAPAPLPALPLRHAVSRKSMQALNRLYWV
jgi:hypothetical protein